MVHKINNHGPATASQSPVSIQNLKFDTSSRQETNIATITRRRFSSSQYDEYFKSQHTKLESASSEMKVHCLNKNFVVDLHEL